jgi:hypothetical protein
VLSELHCGRLRREEANPYINPHKNSHSFAALLVMYKLAKKEVQQVGLTTVVPIGPSNDSFNLPAQVTVTTPKRECVVELDGMRIFYEKVLQLVYPWYPTHNHYAEPRHMQGCYGPNEVTKFRLERLEG